MVTGMRSALDEAQKGLQDPTPGDLVPWRARGYIPAPLRSDPREPLRPPTGRLAREVMRLLDAKAGRRRPGGTTSRTSRPTRRPHPWSDG